MRNELLLLGSLIVLYGGVLLWMKLFGKQGLYGWTVLATIAANIEVLILVDAFGMEQTLGNVLFASTFLVTDILSESYGKKAAQRAVNIGILTSLSFIVISQSWMLYVPSPNDFISPSIEAVFQNTPRMMLVSLLVYAITQRFDVWLYHACGISPTSAGAIPIVSCGCATTAPLWFPSCSTLCCSPWAPSGACMISLP